MRVDENLPSVTVLIAARPGQGDIKAAAASRSLDYPREKLQILIARGRQPSAQRNAGMKAARGEVVYFLDDDSVPRPGNLRIIARLLRDPAAKMAGGPNVCPPQAPPMEQVFALVLGSVLAFGPSRARYTPVGEVRATSEKELILCNLAAKRSALLELGGFNEALYPNEENALMDELQKRGGKLMYDPQLLVERQPRPNLSSFARMVRTYGRGRAEQFRLHPTLGSALNFVPPLFVLYVFSTLIFLFASPRLGQWMLWPFALYGLVVIAQVPALAANAPLSRCFAALPLIVLTHLLYGWGFWRGLFTRLNVSPDRSPVTVAIEEIDPAGSNVS